MLPPCLRFGNFHPDVESEQRRQSSGPEHGAPSPVRQDQTRSDRSQQISAGVTALDDATQESTPARRSALHGQGGAHPPLAAHAYSEQCAQNGEGGIVGRKAASDFHHREKNNI